jgi:N-acetyl-beta-hexosaminidase
LDSFNGDLTGLQALAGTATATVATPVISPNGGNFSDSVQVTLSCGTAGASIHYTTDGSSPSSGSPVYVVPLSLTATSTVKAKAFKSGYTDSAVAAASFTITVTPTVATPTITPPNGNFSPSVQITLACTTAGATIHYTTDGNIPTSGSPTYIVPLTLTASATVKAKAFASGYNDSAVATGVFTVTPPQTVSTPTISPAGGSFIGSVQVTLDCLTPGSVIHYTTDGNDPTAGSPTYLVPLTLTTSATVKAKAFASGYNDSVVASASFTVSPPTAATPSFTPAGGSFNGSVQVTLACSTVNAVIRYTTDGNDPTVSSPIYSAPLTISSSSVIKAKAFASGYADSAVGSASFTIVPLSTVATPSISPSGGNFSGSVQVTLNCATPGSTVRYTTDGNDPTASSTLYAGPFTLSSSATVKAKGFSNGYLDSAIASSSFTVLPFAITGIGGGGVLPPNSGVFQLELHSSAAQLVIQSSSDMVHWIDVGTLPVTDGKAYFIDGSAGANGQRFYRIKP